MADSVFPADAPLVEITSQDGISQSTIQDQMIIGLNVAIVFHLKYVYEPNEYELNLEPNRYGPNA